MIQPIIDQLANHKIPTKEELTFLIDNYQLVDKETLFEKARAVQKLYYGNKVYMRGLIEFTNYCRNNCYYCGIRKSNLNVKRYHLTKEQIIECCNRGYDLGFMTFVLQGGEDLSYSDQAMVELIKEIKRHHPDCAITLSIGERSYDSYLMYYEAGADRYLLRHETANATHYSKLHPESLQSENRKRCLYDLKRIGYQVGSGFMVGSPYQTASHLAEDLLFLYEFQPQMVGIGPFIPQHDTPFAQEKGGKMEQTLFMLALLRLLLPNALLPATTALGSVNSNGRENGILAGANVVMPNLSPDNVRSLYSIYDNKLSTGEEAAESCKSLKEKLHTIGYDLVVDRGDWRKNPLS